jgi:N-acyl-D-amino-acid deacylase
MPPEANPKFDLVIRHGRVVDGTGTPAFPADVAIAGDRIAIVGEVAEEGVRAIDASGLVVAPGFIDVHTHDDLAVLNTPAVDFKVHQGVTTDIVGNCGIGAAPASEAFMDFYKAALGAILGPVDDLLWRTTEEYYRAVEEAGPSLNVASFVPHGTLRLLAMGLEQRRPTPDEMASMKEMLAQGMEAGALGLSTGLIYPPGMFSATEELIELGQVAGEHGGIYASHIRNEDDAMLDAVAEALRIGEEGGVPVQVSHHKATMERNWGKVEQSLRMIDEARARGLDVTVDVYPYTAGSTYLGAFVAHAEEMEMSSGEELLIASVKHQHEYEGMTLADIAKRMGLSLREAGLRLLQEEENAVVVVAFGMSEDDVQRVMRYEHAMFGSDGIPSPTGKPHPRLYGTFPRILGHYVREQRLFPLEEAVRKMTSLPARKHHLRERGEVRPGWFADLCLFDPEAVADRATYQEPRQYPEGIPYVIVNGVLVVDGGVHTGAHAGRVLRHGG